MRNEHIGEYVRTGVPATDHVAATACAGYEDARTGTGYPREYDSWVEAQQMTYEAGRRAAAVLSKYVKPLPAWPMDREFGSLFDHASDAAVQAYLAEDAFTSNKRVA